MIFSFAIIGSIAATTPKFVNKTRTQERWNCVFNCEKVIEFMLSLENKPDITVREIAFHYTISSCAYLRSQFTELWKDYYQLFLGIVITITFGASILSKNVLIHMSTKSCG